MSGPTNFTHRKLEKVSWDRPSKESLPAIRLLVNQGEVTHHSSFKPKDCTDKCIVKRVRFAVCGTYYQVDSILYHKDDEGKDWRMCHNGTDRLALLSEPGAEPSIYVGGLSSNPSMIYDHDKWWVVFAYYKKNGSTDIDLILHNIIVPNFSTVVLDSIRERFMKFMRGD